jgi:hypothetical protein
MAKNEFIKRPNALTEYTQENLDDLYRCASDPVHFAKKFIMVQHPKKGAIPLNLYDYQVRAIEGFLHNRWCIVKAGRQLGKTTIIAVYLLWFACFNKDKNVLVASKDNSGAMDIMDRIRFAYEELPAWLKPGVKAYNRHSIEFDNGSAIRSVSTTENTGRGKSISLLMLDELAFVRTSIQGAMWTALAPTLSTGGSCIISSTPNGDSELFAQLWREAVSGVKSTMPGDETEDIQEQEDDFFPIDVGWDEHPDRTEKYKATMIKKIGLEKWNQEYECQFLSSDPLLINTLVLSLMKSKLPLYTDKGFYFWKEPDPQKTYILGVDVAEGMEQDFSTIQIIELETLEQIAEYRNNTVKENQLYDAIKYALNKLHSYVDQRTGKRPTIYWSFENNSAGAALGALYYNDEKFPDFAELVNGKETRLGMRTVNKSKVEACRYFKKLIEQTKGGLTINSKMLIFEMKNFIATGAGYQAKRGATDDLICAFLIVLRVMKYLSDYEPEVFDKLYKSEGDFYEETSNDYDDPVPFVM